MSLSRPVKFPLLKLPWLCIKDVVKSWDIFDIIFFALLSKKTRRIVRSLNIPLNRIQIFVLETTRIWLGGFSKSWFFSKPSSKSSFDNNLNKYPIMLQNNPIPVYTSRTDDALTSYAHQNTMNTLRMAMEFLNEVFNCSIEKVEIDGDNIPASGNICIKSTINFWINQKSTQPFGYAQSQKLRLLLENLEVTDTCYLRVLNSEKEFYVDPKLFKCKRLVFRLNSAAWVTREILLQFEVPQLRFNECPFSEGDIVAFVTQWFHSDNRTFQYLYVSLQGKQISWELFQGLNPLPCSERNRVQIPFVYIDFSKGLEIVRHDGLRATTHVDTGVFLFYIYHNP